MTVLALLTGCTDPFAAFAWRVSGVPGIQDLGELAVIPQGDFTEATGAEELMELGVVYERLGALEDPQATGGATFQFRGTGQPVYLVLDPEAVFWNYAVAADATGQYRYQDRYEDDGDVDLRVGLSAYYTGSPGVEIGAFEAQYTDDLGVDHYIEFDECLLTSAFGVTGVHSGRGYVESCGIDTSTRVGVLFTVLVETFSLPVDDDIVSFAVAAIEGEYDANGNASLSFTPDECTFPNEVGWSQQGDGLAGEDEEGEPYLDGKDWFVELEEAFCTAPRKVNDVCEAWLSEDPDSLEGPCVEPSFSADYDYAGDTGTTE